MVELPARIASKIEVGPCWTWMASLNHNGYGKVWFGRTRLAYGVVWELLVGPIPDGMTLDHLCRNPACVNPDHLQLVTIAENILRGYSVPAKRARQTHCKHGHHLSGKNLHIDKRGHRRCKECGREHCRKYRASR